MRKKHGLGAAQTGAEERMLGPILDGLGAHPRR
jgi:hypothetical protein